MEAGGGGQVDGKGRQAVPRDLESHSCIGEERQRGGKAGASERVANEASSLLPSPVSPLSILGPTDRPATMSSSSSAAADLTD